jgi:hypothetical protein
MKQPCFVILAVAALLGGCGGSTDKSPAATTTSPPIAEENSLKIPPALVSGALRAMGYPFDKKITYQVTGFPTADDKSTQTVVTTFEVKDGKNLLTMAFDGEPHELPSETYELRTDAIYGVAAGGVNINPPLKALPNDLAPGVGWISKGTLEQAQKILMDTTLRVVGVQHVKVKAGQFDATLIKESGTIKVGGNQSFKVSAAYWYVSGVGAVKRTVSQTDSAGNTSNITIEAISID